VKNHIRNYERQIDIWDEIKFLMRRRFVSSHYYRKLYQKLQNLSQGTKNVDEYFKKMKLAMIRADVKEDREAIMARFINGLNYNIAYIVELHHYVELEEMVHLAMKMEKQLTQKGTIQQSQPLSPLKP
jgi:hypothetical protein